MCAPKKRSAFILSYRRELAVTPKIGRSKKPSTPVCTSDRSAATRVAPVIAKPYIPTDIASVAGVWERSWRKNGDVSSAEASEGALICMIVVNDRMQRGYSYLLTEPTGRNFDPGFRPELAPKEMLALGVFGGKYMTDCQKEFPASWFAHAKLSPRGRDCSLNYFRC
jgi:hypothetical protein